MRKHRIGAVILAAGDSRRMGTAKSLLTIEGKSFLQIIFDNLAIAECDPVRIVAGKHHEKILETHPEFEAILIKNNSPDLGQLHSFRLGLAAIGDQAQAVFMCLVDHPFVSTSTFVNMIKASRQNKNKIIIPCYHGQRGHPVIFSENVFDELLSIPLDEGAKPVVRDHPDRILQLNVDDSGILADIDTKEDFERTSNG